MDCYIGTVLPMAFNFAPRGWASCEGQLLPIQQYAALFSLLGTKYGGNGSTNFALPDLRGKAIIGQGSGPGLSSYIVGQTGGTSSTTLTVNNMPNHSHAIFVNANQLTSDNNDPQNNFLGGGVNNNYTSSAPDTQMNQNSITASNAGGNQPMSILNPYVCTFYNIALTGIFPPRP